MEKDGQGVNKETVSVNVGRGVRSKLSQEDSLGDFVPGCCSGPAALMCPGLTCVERRACGHQPGYQLCQTGAGQVVGLKASYQPPVQGTTSPPRTPSIKGCGTPGKGVGWQREAFGLD